MGPETLRDIARRLVANYRLKRGGSPARLGPAHEDRRRAPPEKVARALAEERAFLFMMGMTEEDEKFLTSMHIDPDF